MIWTRPTGRPPTGCRRAAGDHGGADPWRPHRTAAGGGPGLFPGRVHRAASAILVAWVEQELAVHASLPTCRETSGAGVRDSTTVITSLR